MRGVRAGASEFYFRNGHGGPSYFVQRRLGGNLMVNQGVYVGQALEAVRYADEGQFVFYGADTVLSLKIREAGYQLIGSPRVGALS